MSMYLRPTRRVLLTAGLALALACCGGDSVPTGETFTVLVTGAVGGNLEPCG